MSAPPAVGLSAAAVAHDLRNLLGVVQGSLTLLAEALGPAPLAHEVHALSALVDRAIVLTRQLTAPPARSAAAQLTSARDVLLVVARFARRVVPPGVHLEVDATGELATVCVDRYRLEQALLNLIVNAVHAVLPGGTIALGARCDLSASHSAGAPRVVVFSVRDDGHGIPEALRQKVLEPFFSPSRPISAAGWACRPSATPRARSAGGWRSTALRGRGPPSGCACRPPMRLTRLSGLRVRRSLPG